tara:strand:- start:261 stop:563 length:303 start_codon:yes stop_codon:yes gene_type:complete
MSNKYIEQGLSKEALLKKLARCSDGKKALIQEALDSLEASAVKAAPEPAVEAVVEEVAVVEEAPAPEPVVEAAPVVEEAAPEAKPKKRTYRRKKSTTTKE